ncbi:MAG: hypothetical protein QM589_08325 [Thermomicrobiales bacterium]
MSSRTANRRAFALAGSAIGISAVAPVAARQATPDATPATPGATPATPGGWSFVDDRGTTVEREATPTAVAAMTYAAQSLYDFGYTVAAFFGPDANTDQSGEFNTVGDLDFTDIPYLGGLNAEFDLEAVIANKIDLAVSYSLPTGPDAWSLWFLETAEPTLLKYAPTLGIAMAAESAAASVERFRELARALGADVDTPEIEAEREHFESAIDSLKATAAARPELTVAVIRNSDSGVIVPNYDYFGDLIFFKECGVQFIGNDPKHVSEWGESWYAYSYEELDQLSADVILTLGDLSEVGTFEILPAVVAKQLGVWQTVKRLSYKGFASPVEELATLLTNAEKVA